MSDALSAPLKRVSSGIPALDKILNGGFLEGGIYMIMGTPGAGKTILGNQLSFNHVSEGGRAIYMTLLAETHARMLAHISAMSFYDPQRVGDTLTYISGYTVLEREGLSGLIKLIAKTVRAYRCSVLVLDGLATAEAIAPSELDYRRFLHELQVLVETMSCTAFLLTQATSLKVHPELTMVDGLIYLSDSLLGPRAIREIEVPKFRGSNHLRGRHSFEITGNGITIHPRTEVVLAEAPQSAPAAHTKNAFGIRRLDEMLRGGLPSGSSTTLLGSPGSGRTVLGLHFLYTGLRNGEKALYLGFYEPPSRLLAKASALGLDLNDFVERGQLLMDWQPFHEIIPDALAESILDAVHNQGIQRLFIDGIEPFHDSMLYPERTPRFLAALTNDLLSHDVTTCITAELPDLFSDRITIPITRMSALVDNVIFLRYVELRSQLYRLISILKLRDSDYDPAIREFRISSRGITVASTFKSAEAILTGVARPLPIDTQSPSELVEAKSADDQERDAKQD